MGEEGKMSDGAVCRRYYFVSQFCVLTMQLGGFQNHFKILKHIRHVSREFRRATPCSPDAVRRCANHLQPKVRERRIEVR